MKLLIALSLLTLCGASSVETSVWSRVTQKSAPSYDVVGLARSLIDCIIRCKRGPTCAIAAFDVVSKMCALLSTAKSLKPILEANDDIKIYIDTGPVCKETDAPPVANAVVTSWQTNPTALVGDVTCLDDYLYDGDDTPQVRCLASGQWETVMAGECKQRIWRDKTVVLEKYYPLPRKPAVGWSVCITGFPTKDTNFAVNLEDDSGNIPLYTHVRLNFLSSYRVTVQDTFYEGHWVYDTFFADAGGYPFPFAVGRQFSMKITATADQHFQTYIDGTNYIEKDIVSLTVGSITRVIIYTDVSVSYMDLWCP